MLSKCEREIRTSYLVLKKDGAYCAQHLRWIEDITHALFIYFLKMEGTKKTIASLLDKADIFINEKIFVLKN